MLFDLRPRRRRCHWTTVRRLQSVSGRSPNGRRDREGAVFDYSTVNWLAVIVAAIANVVIGTVWYLPQVFGKQWAALTGREINTSPNPMLYVIAIAGSLSSAYVLALVIHGVGAASLTDGIVTGLVVSIGFQLTSQAVGGA